MVYKNIIFDLGGVVVEWDPAGILEEFTGDPALRERIQENVYRHPDWVEKDRGSLGPEQLEARFAWRTGLNREEISRLMHLTRQSLRVKQGTVDWIRELKAKGYALYCLSNMPADHETDLRQRYDFWELFEGVVTSHTVGMVKPEIGIFRHLLHTFELDPALCLFIDDWDANIEAAGRLGLQGILFDDLPTVKNVFNRLAGSD